MTTTRTVRTDRERAQDELTVYGTRLKRASIARDAAKAAADEAEQEFQQNLAIYEHLRNHPAFGDEKPNPVAWRLADPDGDEAEAQEVTS